MQRAPGSVLLALLCLVTVLSFLIITTAAATKQHGDALQVRQGMMRARQLAEMGVAVAAHPQIKAGDPLLRRNVSAIEGFTVKLSTEEARLNLRALLTEERLPVLERVLAALGASPADAQGIAATLMDWTDADDLKRRPDSAEKLDYERMGLNGLPLNRAFNSLDEVEQVPRMAEIAAERRDWRSFFTLHGNGQLDLNTAAAEVIAAATGAPMENVRQLVQRRHAPDGRPLTSLEEALAILGIEGAQAEQLRPMLTPQGPTRRVESIGAAGDARCGIAVVIREQEGRPRILEWGEFPVEAAGSL